MAKPMIIEGNVLTVPVENIGAGPALRIEASIDRLLDEDGGTSAAPKGRITSAHLAGLRADGRLPLEIGWHGLSPSQVPGFALRIVYEDLAGKKWITTSRYVPARERYEDLAVAVAL